MLVAAIQKATLFLFASWPNANPTMLWGFDKLEQQLEELVEEIDNLLLDANRRYTRGPQGRGRNFTREVSRNDR